MGKKKKLQLCILQRPGPGKSLEKFQGLWPFPNLHVKWRYLHSPVNIKLKLGEPLVMEASFPFQLFCSGGGGITAAPLYKTMYFQHCTFPYNTLNSLYSSLAVFWSHTDSSGKTHVLGTGVSHMPTVPHFTNLAGLINHLPSFRIEFVTRFL